jgi:hypothetical protein
MWLINLGLIRLMVRSIRIIRTCRRWWARSITHVKGCEASLAAWYPHGTQPRWVYPRDCTAGPRVDRPHCQWDLYTDLSVVEPESGNRVRTGICSVHDRQERDDIYSAMRPPMTCVGTRDEQGSNNSSDRLCIRAEFGATGILHFICISFYFTLTRNYSINICFYMVKVNYFE